MITVLVVLALLGLVTWALTTYVKMPNGIRVLITIVSVVLGVLYVLSFFGVRVLPTLFVPR